MRLSRWSGGALSLLMVGWATFGALDVFAAPTDDVPHDVACPLRLDGQEGHEHVQGATGGHPEAEGVDVRDVDMTEVFTFRPELGEIAHLRYRLLEPARIQIRVKDARTRELYLATLLNWELREPGEHVETWDGRDYSGQVIEMSDATITFIARKAGEMPPLMEVDPRSPEEIVHSEEQHLHASHHPWAEEVPHLRILEPQAGAEVGGQLVIRAAVDKDRRGYGDQYGYGVRYYVDGILAREEFYKPASDGQFAYRLDTTAFKDGEHLLQIGMCDHHEHATSASVPVIFRNGR